MSWTIETSPTFARRLKQFLKARPRELRAALSHVEDLLAELNAGAKPLNVRHGWWHDERQGLYATDQKGATGKGHVQLRLYVYPETVYEVLWLLTIGEKNTQKRDLQACREMTADLEPKEGDPDGRKTGPTPPDENGPAPQRDRDGE